MGFRNLLTTIASGARPPHVNTAPNLHPTPYTPSSPSQVSANTGNVSTSAFYDSTHNAWVQYNSDGNLVYVGTNDRVPGSGAAGSGAAEGAMGAGGAETTNSDAGPSTNTTAEHPHWDEMALNAYNQSQSNPGFSLPFNSDTPSYGASSAFAYGNEGGLTKGVPVFQRRQDEGVGPLGFENLKQSIDREERGAVAHALLGAHTAPAATSAATGRNGTMPMLDWGVDPSASYGTQIADLFSAPTISTAASAPAPAVTPPHPPAAGGGATTPTTAAPGLARLRQMLAASKAPLGGGGM